MAAQHPLTPFELAYVDQVEAYYHRDAQRSAVPAVVLGAERIVEIAHSDMDKSP